MPEKFVLVAMSGGVDSSIAAAILESQGYRVEGVTYRLWHADPEKEDSAVTKAREVAGQLGIPLKIIDLRDRFRKQIVERYLEESAAGITPNPCVDCNRDIKWPVLFKEAEQVGARYLSSGHYARLQNHASEVILRKAGDLNKDQSYVLSVVPKEILERTVLPLGDLEKSEVRKLAAELGLSSAEEDDSQDLCFIGAQTQPEFVMAHAMTLPVAGDIVDTEGQVLGHHRGLAFYTIGQRKGLDLAVGHPLYVVAKDREKNQITVGDASKLGRTEFKINGVNQLVNGVLSSDAAYEVKIRYKAFPRACTATRIGEAVFQIQLLEPARDVTPGQQAVVYSGDRVVLSGRIMDE